MIDQKARKAAASLVRDFLSGNITNDDLESGWPQASEDRALMAIKRTIWAFYSDITTHSSDRLSASSRSFFDRCALFLESDFNYEWPGDRLYQEKGIPVLMVIISTGLLLPALMIQRRRYVEQEEFGESVFWPFLTRDNYDRELKRRM